ncbi:hypothetical protein ACIBP6_33280 [Nonomuraea terrae]|uniref:hypothetical protein n=1 Tax=Nonomuraea terrae TaxID=2530383 RepID=UPI00379C5450
MSADLRQEALYLAAGVADVLLGGARDVLRQMPQLAEIRQELRARGELAWGRGVPLGEAHLEVLARRVSERNPR